jgi:hypothetical protein
MSAREESALRKIDPVCHPDTKKGKPHVLILVTLAVLARKNSRGWPLLLVSCPVMMVDGVLGKRGQALTVVRDNSISVSFTL